MSSREEIKNLKEDRAVWKEWFLAGEITQKEYDQNVVADKMQIHALEMRINQGFISFNALDPILEKELAERGYSDRKELFDSDFADSVR